MQSILKAAPVGETPFAYDRYSSYYEAVILEARPVAKSVMRKGFMQKVYDYPESIRQSEDVTTGIVWTETLTQTTTPPMMVNRAHFSPAARTCWHEHTHVQILVIENGVALVQAEGEPIEIVRAGQTIVCEPGVRHWHGAAPTHTMTQFGITLADDEGNYATWGEQVTDDEYNRVDSSKI